MSHRLILIHYPSGGFGHFVNAILTLYGTDFARPESCLEFSSGGNSHALPLLVPKFSHNPSRYTLPDLDPDLIYTVLIDNGINDESTTYQKYFPESRTLKICYSDHSWPIVARTMVEKALSKDLSEEIKIESTQWPDEEDWATREKYFLYLRDHSLRHKWRPSDHCHNILVEELLTYQTMASGLADYRLKDFSSDWQRWRTHNEKYILPVQTAQIILEKIRSKQSLDLCVQDLWTQSVTNYFIWLRYNVQVPANDYADWFTNTQQIVTMLENHGVIV
jgi:hypothetical protein